VDEKMQRLPLGVAYESRPLRPERASALGQQIFRRAGARLLGPQRRTILDKKPFEHIVACLADRGQRLRNSRILKSDAVLHAQRRGAPAVERLTHLADRAHHRGDPLKHLRRRVRLVGRFERKLPGAAQLVELRDVRLHALDAPAERARPFRQRSAKAAPLGL
jgi:hypothetical protein